MGKVAFQQGGAVSTWTGAHLTDAGVWQSVSDAATKENFEAIDTQQILERVAALSVQAWRYKSEANGVRHIGPTAQDFKAAFDLGPNDTTIGMIDADGVALAAIKALTPRSSKCGRTRTRKLPSCGVRMSNFVRP